MRTLKEATLSGKTAIIRIDVNVPMKNGKIVDDTRIKAVLPTIKYVAARAKKVVLIAHLGRPDGKRVQVLSLRPIAQRLEQLLKKKILLLPSCKKMKDKIKNAKEKIVMLENIRFHKEEEQNSAQFAKELASYGDVFVNDAFSVCHRAHASVVGITKHLSAYAGFLVEKEVRMLSLKNPKHPFVAVLGGAKIDTKLKLIESLSKRVDALLLGSAMAEAVVKRKLRFKRVLLPIDILDENGKAKTWKTLKGAALDIGPQSAQMFAQIILQAKTVFWNGPVGKFEEKKFAKGTEVIAKAVKNVKGVTIAGGGETLEALKKWNVKCTFISTAGGAALEFIEGKKLPGLVALEAYAKR